MDFLLLMFRGSMTLGSALLLEIVFIDRLSRKKILLWNVLLVVVSFAGVMLDKRMAVVERLVDLNLYALLFTIVLNAVASKLYFSVSWKSSLTFSAISSCLYYSIYETSATIFNQLYIAKKGLNNRQLSASFLLLMLVVQLVVFVLSRYARNFLKEKGLYRTILEYTTPKLEPNFSLFTVVLTIAIGLLLKMDSNLFYGVSAAIGSVIGIYVVCRNVLLFRKYEENEKEYYEAMKEYSREADEINQEILDFKHDYHNILLSLNHYLKSENMDELKTYYKEHILSTIHDLDISSEKKQ